MKTRTQITKIFTFDAAHWLDHHDGKCRRIHGHTYKLEVTFHGRIRHVEETDPESGMIVDFGILKDIVQRYILNELDHELLNDVFNYTTAELMVGEIFAKLDQALFKEFGALSPLKVTRIRLWETPTSYAEIEVV